MGQRTLFLCTGSFCDCFYAVYRAHNLRCSVTPAHVCDEGCEITGVSARLYMSLLFLACVFGCVFGCLCLGLCSIFPCHVCINPYVCVYDLYFVLSHAHVAFRLNMLPISDMVHATLVALLQYWPQRIRHAPRDSASQRQSEAPGARDHQPHDVTRMHIAYGMRPQWGGPLAHRFVFQVRTAALHGL